MPEAGKARAEIKISLKFQQLSLVDGKMRIFNLPNHRDDISECPICINED